MLFSSSFVILDKKDSSRRRCDHEKQSTKWCDALPRLGTSYFFLYPKNHCTSLLLHAINTQQLKIGNFSSSLSPQLSSRAKIFSAKNELRPGHHTCAVHKQSSIPASLTLINYLKYSLPVSIAQTQKDLPSLRRLLSASSDINSNTLLRNKNMSHT